jgi:ankyrin repeat protein
MKRFAKLISVVCFTMLFMTAGSYAGEIHEAAAVGDLDKVRALIEADLTLVESRDGRGCTPLYIACIRHQVAVAHFLIDNGADVNARNNGNQTPLHAANGVYGQDVDLIKRLIAKGANVNAQGSRGETPLHWAAARGNLTVAKLLMDNDADPSAYDQAFGTVLQHAINQSHPQMAKLLIENGAKLNQKDPSGRTELHLAAINGYADLTRILIENSAGIHAVDRHNRTALYYTAKHGYRSVADILVAAGANQDAIVESNYGPAPQLAAALQEGEAYFWYLGGFGGDGYAVKTKGHLLLFDPPGIDESPEADLANGHLNTHELAGQKITVLITKPHWERYPLDCIEIVKRMPDVDLVISFKPETKFRSQGPVPPYRLARPHKSFAIGGVQVHTIPATLGGLAYLVEADGIKVFHAGYHVSNKASQDASYRKEIDFLKTFGPIDVAMLPVAGHAIESYTYDSYLYLVDQLLPKAVYLMHGYYSYDVYLEVAELMRTRPVTVKYPEGRAGGDRFHYSRD